MIDATATTASTVSELLQNTAKLSPQEFESFFSNILTMNARRKASSLSAVESVLLTNINKPFSQKKMDRFLFLDQKRKDETIETVEHVELLRLVRQLGQYDTQRIQWISQLALLRNISLNDLMLQLGFFSEHNGQY